MTALLLRVQPRYPPASQYGILCYTRRLMLQSHNLEVHRTLNPSGCRFKSDLEYVSNLKISEWLSRTSESPGVGYIRALLRPDLEPR
jgi:hypothetical protein